ncbi:flagellin [Anaerovibrio lipolyticus]|uniref:flagellin n=1 Tax=Anaerovibrio lipolyticus TaxID=82374 RepID=UPI0026EDE918|nr:flagellin [Anaerovibrio lipolyticus]
MHCEALGIGKIKVVNRDEATNSLKYIDRAIEIALGEITDVGAYISRLDFTDNNIITAQENTMSAESVIRDTDMAKEMTGFATNNILSQAAQSMLAQANQNSSMVLSLLQ